LNNRHENQLSEAIDEASLGLLFAVLWAKRWIIAALTVSFAALAILYALNATVWYRADVLMVQAESNAVPASLGSLGGLASLAGISIGEAGVSRVPIAVLKSRDFARDFIAAEGIESALLDAAASGSLFSRRDKKPDVRDAVAFFDENVRFVGEDEKTGLVKLAVTWVDPEIAAAWANKLIVSANERLRRQALDDAERSINYLRSEISSTNVVTLQQSLGKVLESEMQRMLVARGNEEFAFKVIDRAVPPRDKFRPMRTLIAIGGVFLGFLVGVAVALIAYAGANRSQVRVLGAGG
jgi:uncharacterized protein involved in exopolysaccharide biosynthesis